MKAVAKKPHEIPLPSPPAVCAKHNKPTTQNLIVVTLLSGIEQKGPFWQYGRYDRSRRKVKLFLKPGYRFVRWEGRCESCQGA